MKVNGICLHLYKFLNNYIKIFNIYIVIKKKLYNKLIYINIKCFIFNCIFRLRY